MSQAIRIDKLEKNVIINGGMDFFQRRDSISYPAIGSGSYVADRFCHLFSGTMVQTVSRALDAPTFAQAGFTPTYSIQSLTTTAQASLSAGHYSYLQYAIEGYDLAALQGKTVTLSFWVKSTKTGIACVRFSNLNADGCYVAEYTINSANTWEKKTITLPLSGGAIGTWNYLNGLGLRINFILASGSTYRGATTNTWLSGTYLCSNNQINFHDTTSATFQLALVMLKEGTDTDAPFTRYGRSIQEELALCQRYYEKSWDDGSGPATSTNSNGYICTVGVTGNSAIMSVLFAVKKRVAPSCVVYSPATNNPSFMRNNSASSEFAANIANSGQDCAVLSSTAAATGGQVYTAHWTADAEF